MKLLALDGNSLVNRAFYGIRSLSNKDGLPTNAIYGFLNIYLKLIKEEAPDGVCVAFDTSAPTFRRERYEGYKASRKGMPEELAMQMPYLKDVLDALGVTRMELPGWEADDILGTVSRLCREQGHECMVVTGDRDSLQLITDATKVRLVLSKGDKVYTPEIFSEEYGFEPIKLIDLKALMGDSSDEIPGVPGVGEKTALDLVRRFGTVEELYASLDGVKDSVRKKLEAGKEKCELSKWLAAINCAAPVEFDPVGVCEKETNGKALREILGKLELKKLIERFDLPESGEEKSVGFEAPAFEEVGADDFIKFVSEQESITFAVCGEYWAALGGGSCLCANVPEKQAFARRFFATGAEKTGHGIKELLSSCDVPYASNIETDTALLCYLSDPSGSGYTTEKCAERVLNITLSGEGAALAASHAGAIAAMKAELLPQIREQGMSELFERIEMPLIGVLAGMEQAGFLVDKQGLEQFGSWLTEAADTEQSAIWELAGESFNINSTKILGEILFEKLGLPSVKKTKSGYSTDIEVLEKLQSRHEIVPHIIAYRKLTKLKSTYAQGLQKEIDPDGRIRTNFNMTATATGRLSSTEPNLQNIPVRGQLGSEVRKFFITEPGWTLIDADYSQIELRILAHISEDENMINSFVSGEDIHRATAAQVFNVGLDEVTPQMRSRAKAVNFGIVYGISDFALSQDIGVSRGEARMYMDAYLERFSGVRSYMENIKKLAAEQGYVATLYGRRRYLPELKSANRNIRAFGERVALNAPIQGTAADIIKLAMVEAEKALREEGLLSRLILQVHDELIVESPILESDRAKELLVDRMQAVASLRVPLVADASMGADWLEAKA